VLQTLVRVTHNHVSIDSFTSSIQPSVCQIGVPNLELGFFHWFHHCRGYCIAKY
jgi:hypothetical protein